MIGLRFMGCRTARLVEMPKPVANGPNVVVEVKASALCGTDLPYYAAPGDALGCVPGHEIAGRVAEVDRASYVREGERVVLNTQVGCGRCEYCRRGQVLFCPDMRTIGLYPNLHGGHGDYVLIPEKDCLPLPDDIPYDVGSVIPDGVGVPYHAAARLGVCSLDTVTVFGTGPIGLGMVLLLKSLAARVIAVETREYRRNLARNLGADYVIDPSSTDVLAAIRNLTYDRGVDKAIDCSPMPITTTQAIASVKKGGKIALVGQKDVVAIENYTRLIIARELDIISSCGYNLGEYDSLIALVRKGLGVEKMITHRFPLQDAPEAYRVFSEGDTGKVVIIHGS